MATNTLLQKLDGGSDFDGGTSNRRQVESFLYVVPAGSGTHTLDAGNWMAFDSGKTGADRVLYVEQAAAVTNGNPLVVGVLRDDISVEQITGVTQDITVHVVVAGYVDGVKTTGSVATDIALVVDTTAGTGSAAAATDLTNACGVTLGPESSGVAPVWVYKSF